MDSGSLSTSLLLGLLTSSLFFLGDLLFDLGGKLIVIALSLSYGSICGVALLLLLGNEFLLLFLLLLEVRLLLLKRLLECTGLRNHILLMLCSLVGVMHIGDQAAKATGAQQQCDYARTARLVLIGNENAELALIGLELLLLLFDIALRLLDLSLGILELGSNGSKIVTGLLGCSAKRIELLCCGFELRLQLSGRCRDGRNGTTP